MMFKKITLAIIALALVASLASCAKYGDLKDSMDKMGKSVDKLVADGDKAADAKAAAAAIGAYAEEIKTNASTYAAVFEKYSDDLSNPATEYPAEVKASHDKFVKFGEQLSAAFVKINTNYGTDQGVMDAYTKHYDGLKKSIASLNEMTSKFSADIDAAKDGKSAAPLIGTFSDAFRKAQDHFNSLRPLYPELSFLEKLPDTLESASQDYGQLSRLVSEAMTKTEAFASDAAVMKAMDSRYSKLKDAIEKMLKGTEDFVSAMDKAKDAKATASAIEGFAGSVRTNSKIIAVEVRLFPELQSKGIEGLPVSLGDPLKKMNTLQDKARELITASTEKYKDDEGVKKAMAKLNGQG